MVSLHTDREAKMDKVRSICSMSGSGGYFPDSTNYISLAICEDYICSNSSSVNPGRKINPGIYLEIVIVIEGISPKLVAIIFYVDV